MEEQTLKTYWDELIKEYEPNFDKNIQILENNGGCMSWRQIHRWSCDVIENDKDRVKPSVIFYLWKKLAKDKKIVEFSIDNTSVFCTKNWLETNLNKIRKD